MNLPLSVTNVAVDFFHIYFPDSIIAEDNFYAKMKTVQQENQTEFIKVGTLESIMTEEEKRKCGKGSYEQFMSNCYTLTSSEWAPKWKKVPIQKVPVCNTCIL